MSSCPGAFAETYSQVNLANIVLYFAVFLGISIALCSVRKKSGAGRKILGLPYILAIFLFLLSYGLELIAAILQECDTINTDRYYSLLIATNVFWYLAYWLLLFVVVYVLNTMLRERLSGVTAVYKVIYIAILGVMFAITCGQIGLTCYNLWTQTEAGYDANADLIVHPAEQLRVAYSVLYLISVIASGALSLMTIATLRSRRHPVGDLQGWIIALIFSMVIWVLLSVVFAAAYLQDTLLTFEASAALTYISNFFQALSFIFLLGIAKHAAWNKTAESAAAAQGYPPVVAQQQYYYQQPPVYNGTGTPGSLHGQGHLSQVK
ncbi:uncharacterized protein K460DRAFT_275791 [Cucurbitaria berberidis CBS 394.84]|uniref:Uncharacterized protein n=1 Tax=Cucurbitaria berberidis CBS 394.84 TaxID=1168544 RepID=A0A9P4GN08_9PLEO|nr:uncharacterized protein K460DRAFT_275791 [Cucurbitaria berberidis CBS 394.84]KAF1848429.1 hypothetical protein K460DRAFT_275791 [Cucurbitaria berberidis CBS 394.84]